MSNLQLSSHFLERLIEATELTADMAVWNQCYNLESSQNRIETPRPTLQPAPLATPRPNPLPTSSPSPAVNGECWKDLSSNRAMEWKGPNLGINDCINHCLNHQKKYPFAAVQYGKECFCGFTYQKHGPALNSSSESHSLLLNSV